MIQEIARMKNIFEAERFDLRLTNPSMTNRSGGPNIISRISTMIISNPSIVSGLQVQLIRLDTPSYHPGKTDSSFRME